MSGFPGLGRVTDPSTAAVLKSLFDEIATLKARVASLEGSALLRTSTVDAQNLRMTNLAPGTQPTDATTLSQVQALVDAVKKASY